MPDRISEVYRGHSGTPSSQTIARRRVARILELVPAGPVLEVGCSQGIISLLCAERGLEVVGLDVDSDALRFAEAERATLAAEAAARVTFVAGDAYAIPFEEGRFRTVILAETIEHLKEPPRALSEIHRVLQPGGTLILTTPLGFMFDPEHVQTFLPHTLGTLVARDYFVEVYEVLDVYLVLVGRRTEKGAGALPDALLTQCWTMSGEKLVEVQKKIYDEKQEIARLAARIREVQQQRDKLHDQLTRLSGARSLRWERSIRRLIARVRSTVSKS